MVSSIRFRQDFLDLQGFAAPEGEAHGTALQDLALRVQHEVPGVGFLGSRLLLEPFLPSSKLVQLDDVVPAVAAVEGRGLIAPLLVNFVSLSPLLQCLQGDAAPRESPDWDLII